MKTTMELRLQKKIRWGKFNKNMMLNTNKGDGKNNKIHGLWSHHVMTREENKNK